jgi:type IV fimbrial biogenesis protein FimT
MRVRAFGFSLIELMVALAVAAILISAAVPGFQHLIISSRLTTTANELVAALNMARSEAIKRNAAVNLNSDGAVKINNNTVRAAIEPPAQINLGSVKALIATPFGLLQVSNPGAGYSGLVADIGSPQILSNNHRCVYLATGSVINTCRDSNSCGATQNASCAN